MRYVYKDKDTLYYSCKFQFRRVWFATTTRREDINEAEEMAKLIMWYVKDKYFVKKRKRLTVTNEERRQTLHEAFKYADSLIPNTNFKGRDTMSDTSIFYATDMSIERAINNLLPRTYHSTRNCGMLGMSKGIVMELVPGKDDAIIAKMAACTRCKPHLPVTNIEVVPERREMIKQAVEKARGTQRKDTITLNGVEYIPIEEYNRLLGEKATVNNDEIWTGKIKKVSRIDSVAFKVVEITLDAEDIELCSKDVITISKSK